MRRIVLAVLAGSTLAIASTALAAGLADPLESVDREWQGRVHVRKVFGKPERVGHLALETRGLFGAGEGEVPSKVQFFRGIRKLMPRNFKFVAGYRRKARAEEVYTFRSNELKAIPGIKEAEGNNGKRYNKGTGTFTLVVDPDRGDANKVTTCTLHVGLPDDFSGDIILCNPFKL